QQMAHLQAMMARGVMPAPGGSQQALDPQGPMPGYGAPPPGYLPPPQGGSQMGVITRVPPPHETANPAEAASVAQLPGGLKESMCPSQREWAASRLAEFDARTQPAVVDVLVRAAKEDPAAIVRAACVRSLARMGVASQVAATLQALKSDADPRVAQEAEL